MSKFVYNYKKKQYQREIERINKSCKGRSTLKELLIRKLETSQEYEMAVDNIRGNELPVGLEISENSDTELLNNALNQVLKIAYDFNSTTFSNDRLTNYRFYINTPYFDRNGNDPHPLFRLDDPRIKSISDLVLNTVGMMGISETNMSLLNIIVRIYRPGDILNFHSDREIFGENVYGIILQNSCASRGLMLKNKRHSFMLEEKIGTVWKLGGDSRWSYEHGYCTNFHDEEDFVRISVSFRFFQEVTQIPKKDYEELLI